MTRAVEETALSRRDETTGELAPSYSVAAIEAEIQASITIALKFPRNEDTAFQKLMRACKRTSFAEDSAYAFPRGKKEVDGKWIENIVSGPSVNLAREAARVWGNIRYGLEIIRDDEHTRQIRGWAWDLETNTKTAAEDNFRKVVQRKHQGKTVEIAAEERDLRELSNRRGAILVRNAILSILPKDLIEDALAQSKLTIQSGVEQDPDGARKKTILAFSELNVTPDMLEEYLGHPIGEASPAEIANLRNIYKSISDGNSRWVEYTEEENKTPPAPRPKTTPPAAPRITEEQCDELNQVRVKAQCPSEKFAEILKTYGFSLIAAITPDKFHEIAEAVRHYEAPPAQGGDPQPKQGDAAASAIPPGATPARVAEIQRSQITDLIEGIVETEKLTRNQVMDIVEQMGGSRGVDLIKDELLPNVKIRLEAELKKARGRGRK